MNKILLKTILVGGGALLLAGLPWLGVTILDQKFNSLPPLTERDLIENGFEKDQAGRILQDAKKFEMKLSDQSPLVLESRDTEKSIREKLKSIVPDVSKEFLDIVAPQLFLLAQQEQDPSDPGVSESVAKHTSENSTQGSPLTDSAPSDVAY